MKKCAAILIMALLACCAATAAFAEYPTVNIRLSHNQPVGSPEDVGAEAFKKIVEERSGGKMTVEIFPQGQMGSMREQTEMVQMGTLDMSIQPVSVLTPFVEELQIIDFPFLWPSREALYKVMDGELGARYYAYAEPKGLKIMSLWAGGFKQITTRKKQIHVPDDFKGMTIRVMPSPLLVAQYKSWGANPVPIEYAELYNSLQQGIVDGQENPIQSIALGKFFEVQDYLTLSSHGFFSYLMIANPGWFDGLPDDAKKLVAEAEHEAANVERKTQLEREDGYLEQIKKSKIVVNKLTPEEYKAFADVSRAVHDQFASTPEMKELLKATYEAIEKAK